MHVCRGQCYLLHWLLLFPQTLPHDVLGHGSAQWPLPLCWLPVLAMKDALLPVCIAAALAAEFGVKCGAAVCVQL